MHHLRMSSLPQQYEVPIIVVKGPHFHRSAWHVDDLVVLYNVLSLSTPMMSGAQMGMTSIVKRATLGALSSMHVASSPCVRLEK